MSETLVHPSEWRAKHCGAALIVAVVWCFCISHLAIEWRHNPEYQHGWLMPLGVGILLVLRFRQAPWQLQAGRALVTWRQVAIASVLLALWLPVRVVAHANEDWHLISWVMIGLAFALTVSVTYALGRKRAVGLYAMPFLIIIGAVPLPYMVEYQLIDVLKRVTTAVTVEVLHLFGVAAERTGRDLIQLKPTTLGIEDGCTGIRSLHLCLAAALFWGELNRLAIGIRGVVVLCAGTFALLMNVIRSVGLAILAELGGTAAFARFHELIGSIAQVLTLSLAAMGVMLGLRWFNRPLGLVRRVVRTPGPRTVPRPRFVGVNGWLFVWVAVGLVVMEGVRTLWYAGGVASLAAPSWTFAAPTAREGFRTLLASERQSKLMGADYWYAADWRDDTDRLRVAHYLYWSPKNQASVTVRGHRPEICLAGAGFEMMGEPTLETLDVLGEEHAFRRYAFQQQGREVIVFFGVWSSDGSRELLQEDASIERKERLLSAWRGERHLGRRLLEVGFWDTPRSEANRRMEKFLQRTFVPLGREPVKEATYAIQ